MGVPVIRTGDAFRVSLRESEQVDSLLRDAAPHLQKMDALQLDFSGTQLADAVPLANFTNLQRLDLSRTQIADAAPA